MGAVIASMLDISRRPCPPDKWYSSEGTMVDLDSDAPFSRDDILRAVHDPSVHLEVLDVDIKPRGGFSTCELFLRDPDLRAPLDALVACKENHAVDAKIPVLTAALEAMTLKPKGDENAGSTATFSSSKDAKDPRGALAGEVLLARS